MKLTKETVQNFGIDDYLGKSFTCECGKDHRVAVEKVVIGNGAIRKIPEILSSFGFKKAYMAADKNTYEAAGSQVEKVITEAGIQCSKHVYIREHDLVPDETAAGEFIFHMDRGTDVILAVGSGVLNDLCKFMSCRLGIPYIIVATAPSMDGYASDGSALSIENLKTTLSTTMPKAIIGDVDILKKAPLRMIKAGFGDMVGKYSAINDWKLSHAINGEYYCGTVAKMVEDSLEKCIKTAEGLKDRKDNAIQNLMEGLVITGIAMSFTGNSRPASGSEHHLSHFIEMMYLFDGKEAPLHGEKVGVNTLVMNSLREKISNMHPDLEKIKKIAQAFNKDKWTKDVKTLFRQAAPGVIRLNEKEKINDPDERLARVEKVIGQWEKIVGILRDVPPLIEIEAVLRKAEAPVTLKELGIDRQTVINGLIYAKEVRARYTVLQLAWDLGVLDQFSGDIGEAYC